MALLRKEIHFRLFISISLGFILFTIIGTLSHEGGHHLTAKSLGYHSEIHYAYTVSFDPVLMGKIKAIYTRNKAAIEKRHNFPEKHLFDKYNKQFDQGQIIIIAGGILQTILTGSLGFFLLLYRRKKSQKPFNWLDWSLVLVALFWLREVFNAFIAILIGLINNSGKYFGGDEANLAALWGLPKGVIALPLGIIGLVICLYIIFKLIPIHQRLTFIIGGFVGGVSGYIIWIYMLGPMLLP